MSDYDAVEQIWFLGDEFASKTASYFDQISETDSLLKQNFKVTFFTSTRFSTYDANAHSRMRNLLITAIRQKAVLPKYIAVVIEDDLPRDVPYKGEKLSEAYSKMVTWLLNEYRRIIRTYKEMMPAKSQGDNRPSFIFILPTTHTNYWNNKQREIYGSSLQALAPLFPDTMALPLKQLWEYKNKDFYCSELKKYTAEGIQTLWRAIDRTVFYGHKSITSKLLKLAVNNYQSTQRNYSSNNFGRNERNDRRNDRFHTDRRRPQFNQRFMLPKPPTRR